MSAVPLAELSLFLATPGQLHESRKRTSDEWSRSLSLEQYIKRDEVMASQEASRDGKLQTWVLAPRSDPTTLDFMCSCETFRRTAIVARRGALVEVIGYGVASVFTPREKRKKGYAQHMMRLLHWIIAPRSILPDFPSAWGSPPTVRNEWNMGNAQFSVLYSDVGDTFYRSSGPTQEAGSGWVETGSIETTLRLSLTPSPIQSSPKDPGWKWLTEEDTKLVYSRDADWNREDLVAASSSSEKTIFSFLPDKGVADFTVQRTMELTSNDSSYNLPLDTWGIISLPHEGATLQETLANSAAHTVTFATWTLDFLAASRTLILTRLRVPEKSLPQLLAKLCKFARKNKCEVIEIWGLPDALQTTMTTLGWNTQKRQLHLSSFKWYGEETGDSLEWRFNEKFCWC